MWSRKRAIMFLSIFVAVGATVIVATRSKPEPTDEGILLSEWVNESWLGGPKEAEALQKIGTNALPFLLKWIRQEHKPSKNPFRFLLNWIRQHRRSETPATVELPDRCVRAFEALGDLATPVVPELSRLAGDPASPVVADRCLSALALMGRNGVPPLLAAVHN